MKKDLKLIKRKAKRWFDNLVFSVCVGLLVSGFVLLGENQKNIPAIVALITYAVIGLVWNFFSTIFSKEKDNG